jgi:hypothetical protein
VTHEITPRMKVIGKTAAAVFGPASRLQRYWDEAHSSSVDIVHCADSPWAHVTSYSTVGVSSKPVEVEDTKIAWLMAIPISNTECQFAVRRGPKALEDLFEAMQIDVFDLDRESVV